MTRLRALLSRTLDLLLRRRRDDRLDEEILTHLELLTDDYIARGLPRAEAARAARRTFGNIDATRADVREQRGLPRIDSIVQDVRFALRLLRRDRGFAATAVLVLALGIGVNNMLFAILNAHTLRGLPLPRAERVAIISAANELDQVRKLSYPEFEYLQAGTRSFATLLGVAQNPVVVSGDGSPAARLDGVFVSGDAFAVAGSKSIAGRSFGPDDGRAGAAPAALIASTIWQSRYGGDPGTIGRSIVVNGVAATIVGVVDVRSGLPVAADIWLPMSHVPIILRQEMTGTMLTVFGRLRDDVDFAGAANEVLLTGERLSQVHSGTRGKLRLRATPVNDQYFGRWHQPVWLAFMTAGVLVVVISAANVANLMVARTAQRTRELAIRASLGASPGRVVRQLLIEGSVLAALGGALGLLVAIIGIRVFRSAIPQDALPWWIDYSPDYRVIGALMLVSVGTVFVFALLPALQASRADVNRVLKDGGRTGFGRGGQRWATFFLAAEFALCMVLMAHVTVSIRSQRAPLESDALINTQRVLTASVTLSGERYGSASERLDFFRKLNDRLEGHPEIASITVASVPPLMGGTDVRIQVLDRTPVESDSRPVAMNVLVAPRYFETLAVPIRGGRELQEEDLTSGEPAAVVNQEFARRFLSDRDPVGSRIAISAAAAPESVPRWITIIGIAPDVRQRPGPDPQPVVYTPYTGAELEAATILVRSRTQRAGDLAGPLRRVVADIDPELPLDRMATLADVVWQAQWNGRLSHRLLLALTLIATALATVGLYAVTMHAVGRRTHEFGIRMALGARPSHVVRTILRRACLQLAFGFVAGVICIRVWEFLLVGASPDVSAGDPEALLLVGGVLVILLLAACSVPALRAIRLDPVAAIRQE